MRTSLAVAGLLALAVGACTVGANPSPTIEPSAEPSVAAASSPAPQATPDVAPLELAVSWDGTKCSYQGPTVIPDGTLTQFTYSVAGEVGLATPILAVVGVTPGTTWETIVEYAGTHAASDTPDWVILTGFANIPENSSAMFTVSRRAGGDGPDTGGYLVGCATAPAEDGGTDVMYPAALLEIAGS